MRNFNAADLSDHISTELYRHASFFFIYSCPLFFLKGWGRGPCEKVVHCYNSIPSTPTSQSFLAPNSSTLLFLCVEECVCFWILLMLSCLFTFVCTGVYAVFLFSSQWLPVNVILDFYMQL